MLVGRLIGAVERRAGFRLAAWERDFLGAYCDPSVVRLVVSMARGNGKSALMSAILAEHVAEDGVLRRPGSLSLCVAGSLTQARESLFVDVVKLVGAEDRKKYRVMNGQALTEIEHRASGARLRALPANERTAHGLRPGGDLVDGIPSGVVVADEPAQWVRADQGRGMAAALITSLGKRPCRLVGIGTRPVEGDRHFFSEWLADKSPDTAVFDYMVPGDADPHDPSLWPLANPSMMSVGIPDIRQLERESDEAVRDPQAMSSFRALRLNQGVSPTDDGRAVIAPEVWDGLGHGRHQVGPHWFGLDPGGSSSLSALASYWPESGRLEVISAVGDTPDLVQRGRDDGVGMRYVTAVERGELLVSPGRLPDVGGLLDLGLDRWGRPELVVTDSYRASEVMDVADVRGLEVWMRRKSADAVEDLARFRSAALDGHLAPERSLLLDQAVAGSRLESTPGGVRLDPKRSRRFRDDPLSAAIGAVSMGERWRLAPRTSSLSVASWSL